MRRAALLILIFFTLAVYLTACFGSGLLDDRAEHRPRVFGRAVAEDEELVVVLVLRHPPIEREPAGDLGDVVARLRAFPGLRWVNPCKP